MKSQINDKIVTATKWSAITEIGAKIVSPVSNMILARLLTPEAFGVIATITMIISFVDMFTDAGFQKYLIQHEFIGNQEKDKSSTVAFWTNLWISLLLWGTISLFGEQIAELVGNPGLGNVIIVAGISSPLTSFSSIQMALLRRDFDFKTLFYQRIISVIVPFVVTVPLAILGFSYWALIIGTISGNISNAVILTLKSKWKIKLFYNISILKEMISFSIWSLLEAISIWLTSYVDTFIVGSLLSSYYLGVYKTSITTVNQIMSIVTGTTVTVLFSALSRLQDDDQEFVNTFLKFQKKVSIVLMPMGVGIYMYKDLITKIMLGSQWYEAGMFIGLWGLMSSVTIIFAQFCSEVYRAKGKPKLSLLAQVLHLIILIPAIIISTKFGFAELIYTRSLMRLQYIVVHFFIMYFAMKISPVKMIYNVLPSMIYAVIMGVFAYGLSLLSNNTWWSLFSIILCMVFYFTILLAVPQNRKELLPVIRRLKSRLLSSKK